MLNINLHSRSSTVVIGFLIFFIPFFTFLSPGNLKQLSGTDLLEILLSLIVILFVILISSFSLELLIKRFLKKKIILFPFLCLAFYLNFLYRPFFESVLELTSNFEQPIILFGFSIYYYLFIFFELCCLCIIVLAAKFNIFSLRMILIFSILVLVNAFIPLAGYISKNMGETPIISYEIESSYFDQDEILTKRNVYYIILDGMMSIESGAQVNITNKQEVLGNLSNTGLKYIDKSISSYSGTYLTLASIILADYPHRPISSKYVDNSHFFPRMMHTQQTELPLISYLTKANSSFYWSGNSLWSCNYSRKWSCINSFSELVSRNLFKFYLSTPFIDIFRRIFKTYHHNSIDKFLEYIDKNGTPKTPFFAFIHHYSPHSPYHVTNECEPTDSLKYFDQDFEGYKASYQCTLKKVKMFMEKINIIDPEAIVVFQGDHGWNLSDIEMTEKEAYKFKGKIFNAIKAPEICFDKYGLPKTNVNTIRFTLNCAYGFKLPYRENTHYQSFYEESPFYGTVIARKIYE
jgi:hypothetical protein